MVIGAIVLVVLIDLLFIFIPDKETSETENRSLQQAPSLSYDTFTSGRFESQFDDYVSDQFPLRDFWISLETTIARLAGNTYSNGIFLGSDGYLIQDFTYPSEESYEKTLQEFTSISNANPELNIYALIAPTALSILSDKLPLNAPAGDEDGYLDRLFKDLESSGIKTIDLRERFRNIQDGSLNCAASELAGESDNFTVQLYYRTDHHWTTDGAFEAFNAFKTASSLPSSSPDYERTVVTAEFKGTLSASSGFKQSETDTIYVYLPTEETTIDYTVTNVDTGIPSASVYDTSYLETRDKYGMFLGGNHALLKIQTDAVSTKSILVIKDSYANCFIPFLIPYYSKIIVVDPRYYLDDINELIQNENISEVLYLYNAESLAERN